MGLGDKNNTTSIGNTPVQAVGSEDNGWVQRVSVSDYALEIARGNIPNSEPFGSYGRKVTSGAEDNTLLWANGTWYIPAITGEQISVQSTSTQDGVGGTGIRSVHIHYLDADLVPQNEEVVLNGTTSVLTVATNIRFIECAHIETFGVDKKAAGTISFKNIAKTQTYNEIAVGEVRCSSSARMIPAGKRAIIYGLTGSSISGTAAASSTISIAVTSFRGHDFTQDTLLIPIGAIGVQDGSDTFNLPVPHVATEGTIVAMLSSTDKAATISGSWYGWLEDDPTL